jgi:hypothetical protein
MLPKKEGLCAEVAGGGTAMSTQPDLGSQSSFSGMYSMELFSTLSDDQIALLGCATALVTTGSIMCLSYFIGRNRLQAPGTANVSPVEAMPAVAGAARAEDSKQRTAA